MKLLGPPRRSFNEATSVINFSTVLD